MKAEIRFGAKTIVTSLSCDILCDRQKIVSYMYQSMFSQFMCLFIYLFIYNNFICNNQYKKAAIREELNPHVRWPPKNIYKAIKEI